MEITHDRSYINRSALDFIARGYGTEDLYSLRFQFVYTDAERARNAAQARTMQGANVVQAAQEKNRDMKSVMEAIAAEFACYQYNPDLEYDYDSPDWDLFFWCNDLYMTTGGKLSGRDYSYFTLNFNEAQTLKERKKVCALVFQLLNDRFGNSPNFSVAVQYTATLDEQKIRQAAEQVLPGLLKRQCVYREMKGRLKQTSEGVFFMKKHAKSRGYLLSPSSIVQIGWVLDAA